jgi:hypothetical protein
MISPQFVPSVAACPARGSSAPPPPRSGASPTAPLARSLPCERGGAEDGVGSKVTQPMSGNHASTQECASRSRTTYSLALRSSEPEVKPVATRAGMPPIRSSSAIAPEYCWQ